MSATPAEQSPTKVLQFPDRGAERWARVRAAIESNMRAHGDHAAMIAAIAEHMRAHFDRCGMASSAGTPEQIIARLFVELYELEIFVYERGR